MSEDPEIVIRMPMSAWSIVVLQLKAGAYRDVAQVLSDICEQAKPQIAAAEVAAQTAGNSNEPPATETARLN